MKRHYVFYKDRPEWADVTPVPQHEGEINVIRIAYSPEFVDAHDYMRAVLLKDERSDRALEITTTVLQLNPANYTVWEYRRRILTTLGSDLGEEMNFVSQLIDDTSKNYQLWHHRQWLVIQLAEKANNTSDALSALGNGELSFTESIISDDAKHYHAWQHRRWAVAYFKIAPEVELAYTESLINEDMYNNSAWNHRYVTVTKDEGLTQAVLEREIEFAKKIIRLAPCNESSWNYLYGLLVPPPSVIVDNAHIRREQTKANTKVHIVDETTAPDTSHPQKSGTHVVIYPPTGTNLRTVRQFAEELAKTDEVASSSPALLSFLVEVYADLIQARVNSKVSRLHGDTPNLESVTLSDEPEESVEDLLDRAQSLCERLALELDRIRMTYWRYRSRQLKVLADGGAAL